MLKFTQRAGFEACAPEIAEWRDDDSEADWLARAGFETAPVWTIGEPYGFEARAYPAVKGAAVMVAVGGDMLEHVLCDNEGDAFALKLRLIPVAASSEQTEPLRDLLRMGELLFRATHGHSFDQVCSRCAPEELEAMRARRVHVR